MSTAEQRQEWARLAEAATTAPWTVEAGEYSGKDWLIGIVAVHLGGSMDGQSYAVTTDHVHASELDGDARTDAAFIAASRAAVPALLADVDRLTGDNAALSEALDTALRHLKESEADRDKAIEQSGHYEAEVMICHGLLEGLTPGGSEFYKSPERCAEWAMERMRSAAKVAKERNELRAERDALTAELASYKRNGGKPEPAQEETDKAVERLRRIDALYTQHGLNRDMWPYYVQELFKQLDAAQTEYEATYC
jgi:hypothetical protein